MSGPRMTLGRLVGGSTAAAVAAILALNTVYVVHQTQAAVVLRLGRAERVVRQPGLHAKWPLVETAVRLDTRERPVELDQAEVATADKGRLVVDSYLLYRVTDPQRFHAAFGDMHAADARLRDLMAASLSRALGRVPTAEATAAGADGVLAPALDELRRRAATGRLGVEIADLRLRHVAPPASEAEAIYRQMRGQGAELAAQIRADGDQKKAAIVADADRQAATIRGEAEGEALKIRGEGDAKRIAILGQAYGRDPGFARFFRQMDAYQNALAQGDTTLILSPDTAFLRDFSKGPGGE
jgi:modulator of FtsH protease HflC